MHAVGVVRRVARRPTGARDVIVTSSRGRRLQYLLSALHISMTTRTDSAHVLALADVPNTSAQSMLGNMRGSAGHCM